LTAVVFIQYRFFHATWPLRSWELQHLDLGLVLDKKHLTSVSSLSRLGLRAMCLGSCLNFVHIPAREQKFHVNLSK